MYGVQLVMTRTSIDGEGREDVLAWNEGKCADGKIAGILSTNLPTFGCRQTYHDVVHGVVWAKK